MVLRVYESAANIKLPRNSYKQGEFCRKISVNDVRPGDLVFFTTGKDSLKISHVGIMLDDNQFVHASSKKGVVINRITEPYYSRHLIMFGIVPGIK